MFVKLAWRNMRRSLRDDLIYFLTLSLGIALFYSFNAVVSQDLTRVVDTNILYQLTALPKLFRHISGTVTLVFAFLIVYANRFLLKRRAREIGLLLCLGMNRRRLLAVFALELLFVSASAVVIGLLLGLFVSQWLSVLLLRSVDASVMPYRFVFSARSLLLSLLYFGLVDVASLLVLAISLRRFHLIDLIHPARRQPVTSRRRLIAFTLVFVAGVIVLALAYRAGFALELDRLGADLGRPVLPGIIGTYLIFGGLSGVIALLVKACPSLYYRGLRPFTMRSLIGRTRMSWLALGTTTLLLFLTFSILAAGLSFIRTVSDVFRREQLHADFRCVITTDTNEKPRQADVDTAAEHVIAFFEKRLPHSVARTGLVCQLDADAVMWVTSDGEVSDHAMHDAFLNAIDMPTPAYDFSASDTGLGLLTWSDASALFPKGTAAVPSEARDTIALLDGSTQKDVDPGEWGAFLAAHATALRLGDRHFAVPATIRVVEPAKEEDYLYDSDGMRFLIVPDDAISDADSNITSYCRHVVMMFPEGVTPDEARQVLNEWRAHIYGEGTPSDTPFENLWLIDQSRAEEREETASITLFKLFFTLILLYIGFTFLLTTVAVLALQQLTEFYDRRDEYRLLRLLGATKKRVRRQITAQTTLYFFLPLVLAALHTLVGYRILTSGSLGTLGLLSHSILRTLRAEYLRIVGLILLFYVLYFVLTAWSGIGYILHRDAGETEID